MYFWVPFLLPLFLAEIGSSLRLIFPKGFPHIFRHIIDSSSAIRLLQDDRYVYHAIRPFFIFWDQLKPSDPVFWGPWYALNLVYSSKVCPYFSLSVSQHVIKYPQLFYFLWKALFAIKTVSIIDAVCRNNSGNKNILKVSFIKFGFPE